MQSFLARSRSLRFKCKPTQAVDAARYVADGWQVDTILGDTTAERPLPILDGDIGLATALTTANYYRAKVKAPHDGVGRYKGYVWLGGRWRALDFAELVGDVAAYPSGRDQPAARERVTKRVGELAGVKQWTDRGKFRRNTTTD